MCIGGSGYCTFRCSSASRSGGIWRCGGGSACRGGRRGRCRRCGCRRVGDSGRCTACGSGGCGARGRSNPGASGVGRCRRRSRACPCSRGGAGTRCPRLERRTGWGGWDGGGVGHTAPVDLEVAEIKSGGSRIIGPHRPNVRRPPCRWWRLARARLLRRSSRVGSLCRRYADRGYIGRPGPGRIAATAWRILPGPIGGGVALAGLLAGAVPVHNTIPRRLQFPRPCRSGVYRIARVGGLFRPYDHVRLIDLDPNFRDHPVTMGVRIVETPELGIPYQIISCFDLRECGVIRWITAIPIGMVFPYRLFEGVVDFLLRCVLRYAEGVVRRLVGVLASELLNCSALFQLLPHCMPARPWIGGWPPRRRVARTPRPGLCGLLQALQFGLQGCLLPI